MERPNPIDPLCVHSGPHTLWTTTNVAEALPGVVSALTWTFWSPATELGTRRAYAAVGILRRDEVKIDASPDGRLFGVFNGRPALNVDMIRVVADRSPGTSGAAAEEQLLGSVRPGVPKHTARGRLPFIAARFPAAVVLEPRRLRSFIDDHRAWWRQATTAPHTGDAARQALREASDRLEAAQWHHAICSMLAIALLDQLAGLAASVDRQDLSARLATGLGGVEEQRFVAKLWDFSRFDADLDAVLAEYGFHGPGELSLASFRTDPSSLERIAERYRTMPADQSPDRVAERQRAERASARAELLAALPRSRRAGGRALTRLAVNYVPLRETSKAAYVMALDAARAAAATLGAELTRDGHLEREEDVFNLTYDEVTGPARDFRALAAERREQRERYARSELPEAWTGEPELRAASDHDGPRDRTPTLLSGIGVFPGVIEARARVATTVDEAGSVMEGDVLVCHTTDPSWASVFPLAAGLAIDIGSHVSHGALVARELGIPCVINTRVGSEVISTGDLVRIDGAAGTLELVEAGT